MKNYQKIILGSVLLLSGLFPPIGIAATQTYTKYAVLDYSNSVGATMDWINNHFQLKISGNNPQSSMLWMTYYDVLGPQSLSELLKFKDWAATKSVVAEDALLHANINWTYAPVSGSLSWYEMDKFGKFEGANGVLIESSPGVFQDKTTVAYSGVSPYTTIISNLYIGYEEPFDQAVFNIIAAASNLVGNWQYWNGNTWASLTVSDGTSAMTVDGTISFTPPEDWGRTTINNSRSKYFIRFGYASATTSPVINTIKGDTWLRGSALAMRGWDSTSGTIINAGTPLAYNPTPPETASAKFPYQARIPYWSINRFIANPANFQTVAGISKRTWSDFLAYRANQIIALAGYSGLMGDDGGASNDFRGITSADTDFVDTTANSWSTENEAKYGDMVTAFREINTTAKLGLNGQTKSLATLGDWNLAEYHTFVAKTGSPRGITVADGGTSYMCYDDYLPVNNPTGKFGLLIYDDTATSVAGVAWDKSNRGPIVALSKHLIAANENTYFSYYSRGGYVYSEVDDVVLNDDSVVHLATQAVPALATVKRWGTWFPAMGVDFGVPDIYGWNNGGRDMAWKLGADIGGGKDVWRRDYTSAIILHRPAMWNTTADEYTTPSLPMELGGTYYPLYADGTIGAAITTIQLKTGEGAILMKAPVVQFAPVQSLLPPRNLSVQ